MEDLKKFEPLWGSWYATTVLGEGSFGKVYKIERKEFNNTYVAALKHIRVPQSQSEVKSIMADGMDDKSVESYFESVVEDIVNEFVLMSKLKGNSHIVSYEDHKVIKADDKISWDIFIRMELLTSLIDYIRENSISRRSIIKLGIDICKALELCQKHNIIHRDIKPENIFVSENGDFKLGDFGIAREIEKTVAGLSKKGTFTYIAPEVYKGEAYGSTVDIYSLGIVMYRLLNNNRVPFMPPYPQTISHADREIALVKRMSGQPIEKPINADGRLAEIVLKACAFNPKDRYNSPLLMRMELESILYDESEARVIYPKGDKAEIHSVNYIKTEDDSTETIHNTKYDIENAETQFMTTNELCTKPDESEEKSKKNDNKIQNSARNIEKSKVSKCEFNENRSNHNKKALYILISSVIFLILLFAIFDVIHDIKVKKVEKVEAEHIAELNNEALIAYNKIEDKNKAYPYCLYDIDKDGISELVIGSDGKTGGAVDIYRYNDSSALYVGSIETYGNAFELKYVFKNENGLGVILKNTDRTQYGYWSMETDNKLKYNLLSYAVNMDGNINYSIEGVTVQKQEYDEFVKKFESNIIDSYVPPRETKTNTTEATTQAVASQNNVNSKPVNSGGTLSNQAQNKQAVTQNNVKSNSSNRIKSTQKTVQSAPQKQVVTSNSVNNKTTNEKKVTQQPAQSTPKQQSVPAQQNTPPANINDAPPIVIGFD